MKTHHQWRTPPLFFLSCFLLLFFGCSSKEGEVNEENVISHREDSLEVEENTSVEERDSTPLTAQELQGEDDSTGAEGAIAVLQTYYDAINRKDYKRAWQCWGENGPPNGQTLQEFIDGFAETASVEIEISHPGPIEGAAGSRYIDVPVTITAHMTNGEQERYTGSYFLRRAVVDGATAEQRRWHFYSAEITQVEGEG